MRPLLRRRRDQRGAVLVEIVILLPLLLSMLVFSLGIALLLRDEMTVAAATRSGARVGSSVGRQRLADFDVIQAVRAGLGGMPASDLLLLVVFEPDVNGHMPPACRTASVVGVCNRYTSAQIATLTETDMTGVSTCTAGSPDEAWCPMDRIRSLAGPGPDWLGVYVEVQHRSMAPAFFGDKVVTDHVVMRLEPRFS